MPIPEPSSPVTTAGPDGRTVEIHYVGKKISRDDGPAKTVYFPDGSVYFEEWRLDGELHRVGGPARNTFHENGSPRAVEYYREGKRHRTGGRPAETTYDPDGTVSEEGWWRLGLRHRLGGPAWVSYGDDGSVTKSHLSVLHVSCSDDDEVGRRLRLYTEKQIGFLIRESVYRPAADAGIPQESIVDAIGAGIRSVEGIRALASGAPVEWVRAYEGSQ